MSFLSPELLRVVRVDELLSNVGGSEEIACLVIDEFLVHVEPQLQEIGAAVAAADTARIASSAHRFKGSLCAVSAAPSTIDCAGALESAGMRRDLDVAKQEHAALIPKVLEVARALRGWREERKTVGARGRGRGRAS